MVHHNSIITSWKEFYDQRDLVKAMKNDGLENTPLFEKEKKRLHELHSKALNHKK